MNRNLQAAILVGAVLAILGVGLAASAQTCVVPAPSSPPKAAQVVIDLPLDGGHIGCSASARSTSGSAPPSSVVLGAAKCLQARQIGDQLVANDNGWNDGGAP